MATTIGRIIDRNGSPPTGKGVSACSRPHPRVMADMQVHVFECLGELKGTMIQAASPQRSNRDEPQHLVDHLFLEIALQVSVIEYEFRSAESGTTLRRQSMATSAYCTIKSPTENQVLYQPQSASGPLPITVKGALTNTKFTTPAGTTYESTVDSISVQLGAGTPVDANLYFKAWSVSVDALPDDNQTLTITASITQTTTDKDGNSDSTTETAPPLTRVFSVRKLAFQFIFPASGQNVGIDENQTAWAERTPGAWFQTPFCFKLSDPQIVGKVIWLLDGATGEAHRDSSGDPTLWYFDKLIPANPLGALTLTVQAGGLQDQRGFHDC